VDSLRKIEKVREKTKKIKNIEKHKNNIKCFLSQKEQSND